MLRRISSCIFCKTRSTPFWPPAPKENKNILPKLQAFAPADKAFKTCVPLLTPPSKIISNLNKSLTGTHSLVVDVSDARSVFSLDGTAIRDVLSKGSPANMSIDALPLGEVRRTRIAQLAVAFWFTDEMNCQLICFRSVGGYIMDWLKNASEPGAEVNFH